MSAVRRWLLTKEVLRVSVLLPVVAVRLSKRVIMSQSRRPCTNSPDLFCYICVRYTVSRSRSAITEFVHKAYFAYFIISVRNQDNPWVPHIACTVSVE